MPARLRDAALILWATAKRFYDDQCLVRASALAYTSLLSLVPLLAIMFAVLKGLGVRQRLEPLLLSRLSLNPETTEQIIGFIDRVNVGALGTIGAAALLVTVVSVLGTIEASFNWIWRVESGRSPWRKVTDYFGVLLVTPFLLLVSVAITSAGQVQGVLDWLTGLGVVGGLVHRALALAPVLMNAVAIGVLYAAMPNRRASWRALLPAALVAGAAWYGVQAVYVQLQIGVAGYSAIYGALAQLPVTLAWLYVSWAIVLAGAELAAVLELGGAWASAGAPPPDRRALALELLVRAARAFAGHGTAPTEAALARQLGLDVAHLYPVVADLRRRGWLAREDAPPHALVLARDPAALDLGELAALAPPGWVPRRSDAAVQAALAQAGSGSRAALAELSLATLSGAAPSPGEAASGPDAPVRG